MSQVEVGWTSETKVQTGVGVIGTEVGSGSAGTRVVFEEEWMGLMLQRF